MTTPSRLGRRIAIAQPETPDIDATLGRLRTVLESGSFTNGVEVERLEHEVAEALGVAHCVAVSSCTSGLMLVERCLNLCGEVITPSFTFFATAHGLLWNGLRPRFADIDAQTAQIDPRSVARAIGPETGAILGVHLFGCPAPVVELDDLARSRGVPLIFDGAHALGATVDGRTVAAWGDATVYSLSPTKQLTAGEGGLIATRHAALATALRQARNYGKGVAYDCEVLGLNARMTEFQAALCREGLSSLPASIERRRRIAAIYEQELSPVEGIRLQTIPGNTTSGRKDFALFVRTDQGFRREAIEAALDSAGVETRRYFDPPLHEQRLYREFHDPDREPLTETMRASREVVCLPIHRGVSEADAKVIAGIAAAVSQGVVAVSR
ncbi:MAG: DegT/DnrJ/EryC1/StrS family aminotransferase [Acidobacteria bacterium]|nr:DegT/DnrJ/EryC1/StrS family aminotransferase [Acidobacteriota bacterium]MDA1234037.1 DegT/DnrJ/EryC1/StrS family aminotransferase [Acidobacteriota bacterium]